MKPLKGHSWGLLMIGSLLLTGCASNPHPSTINTNDIVALENLNHNNVPDPNLGGNQIRVTALKQAALTLGAQSGLSWRSGEIDQTLSQNALSLRTIFNFDALILNHSVLPPVLVQASNTVNLADQTTLRIASKTYKIVTNARFVTAPPTWRNYLYMDFPKPTLPDKTLLPVNATEQEIWQKEIQTGWIQGVRQADTIFLENLARLKQDFEGIILYRKLLAQHMVTPPYVATTDLGITGDSQQLNIGDKVLRISALSGLQTDSNQWKPIVDERPE